MENSAYRESTRRLFRFGLVVVVGLWWTGTTAEPVEAGAAPTACFSENSICERTEGENCQNCPQDCDCECGDEVCSGQAPYNETCNGCEEDCACYCGDSQCSWPAEGGGPGSGTECEGEPGCDFCPEDCDGCSPAFCYPEVCSSTGEACEACTSSSQCELYVMDAWCSRFGYCTDTCYDNGDCPLGLCCNTNENTCVQCPG